MNNPWVWLWVGTGLAGLGVLRLRPNKAVTDNPIWQTVWTVLMSFGAPFWGGPLFLLYTLLAPEKQLCPHCDRANRKVEPVCLHCGRPLTLSAAELAQVAAQRAPAAAQLAALDRQFSTWTLILLVLYALSTVVLTIFWSNGLTALAAWRYSFLVPGSAHVLLLKEIAWWLPGMFLGILTSYLPAVAIMRVLLGKRYLDYLAYQARRSPAAYTRYAYAFLLVMAACVLVVVTLMLDTYVIAYPDRLVVNRFWSLGETRYTFSQIASLRSSRQLGSNEWDHPLYVIEFSNGERWSTRFRDDAPGQQDALMEYVSEQSGLPIQVVPAFTNADV